MEKVIIKLPHGYYGGGVQTLENCAPTIDTGMGNWHTLIGEPKMDCKQIGQMKGSGYNEMTGRVYSPEGAAPSVRTFSGGGTEIKIAVPEATKDDLLIEPLVWDGFNQQIRQEKGTVGTLTRNCGADLKRNGQGICEPIVQTTRGRNVVGTIRASYHKQGDRNLIKNILEGQGYEGIIEPIALDEPNGYMRDDGTVVALSTDGSSPKHNNRIVEPQERFFKQALETLEENDCQDGDIISAYNNQVNKSGVAPTVTTRTEGFKTAILPIQNYRVRKLTPRECFRLQGVKDEDFEKVEKSQSDSSLYHLSGDSITSVVLCAIFGQLFGLDWKKAIDEVQDGVMEKSKD